MSDMMITDSAALSAPIQQLVDRTLAADRRGGEALWEKACAVADAKAATRRGEWESFLRATGLHEKEARRLQGIAYRGRQSSEFRDKVISGWLRFSVAAIVAQADETEMHRLLAQPEPPTVRQLAAPDEKPDNVVRCLDCHTTENVMDVGGSAKYLCSRCAPGRNIKGIDVLTIRGRMLVRAYWLTDDLAMIPVVRVNEIDHRHLMILDRESGACLAGREFTRDDADRLFPRLADLNWRDRTGVHAFSPELNRQIMAILDEKPDNVVRSALVPTCSRCGKTSGVGRGSGFDGKPLCDPCYSALLAAPAVPAAPAKPAHPACAHCGIQSAILIGKLCEACYSLSEAQKWESGSDDMRWCLKNALSLAQRRNQPGLAAEIQDVADAHGIDMDAPIIEVPMVEEEDTPAPPKMSSSAAKDLLHAEQLIAAVIEAIPDRAIRLIAALAVPDYHPNDTTDPREELWRFWQADARENGDLVIAAMS